MNYQKLFIAIFVSHFYSGEIKIDQRLFATAVCIMRVVEPYFKRAVY